MDAKPGGTAELIESILSQQRTFAWGGIFVYRPGGRKVFLHDPTQQTMAPRAEDVNGIPFPRHTPARNLIQCQSTADEI